MSDVTPVGSDELVRRAVSQLEHLLVDKKALESGSARKALRNFLFDRAGDSNHDGSVGDALSKLASATTKDPLAAIVILRALAVEDLVPEPNENNQIVRSVVTLCEGGLPDVVDFLKIDTKKQNYQKFAQLRGAHAKIKELLSPLAEQYGDLEALIGARREMLGRLQHSIVRRYAGPFGLKDIRTTVEAVLGKVKKVSALEPSLLTDVEENTRAIANAREEARANPSFLNEDFVVPFLATCERSAAELIESERVRFATTVVWGGNAGVELQKKYPLHEPEREIQIILPLKVTGPGMAIGVHIAAVVLGNDVALDSESISLGNVLPGDFSVVLDVMVVVPCSSFRGMLNVQWGEIANPHVKSEAFEFFVTAQSSTIDWAKLEYSSPYSTEVAEGDKFIGRDEKVRNLAAKLLRLPMEPFYITGQKRVGKTSLGLAVADFAKSNITSGSLDFRYILWGSVVHADAAVSVRRLGEDIEAFIAGHLPQGFKVDRADYSGSLAPLIRLSETAYQVAPLQRFVILLDEFDEIHPELFLHGNLAETFFANLRALSRCKNICIILIGGENMPFIMERQGQKLNNFSRINLSYYSRDTEWSDYQQMIRAPTIGILNWHNDAISDVFNVTNGNPFFTQIVCANIFRAAVSKRDADITENETKKAIEGQVSALGTNSFVHLWQDGIPKSPVEREPDILRRTRTLVAIARCLRNKLTPNVSNIASSRASAAISELEISAILNDFVRRDVFREGEGQFGFCLPIFRLWLMDVGISQLLTNALSEELANAVLAEENIAIVRSEEVVGLSEKWPTYRGKHVGTDEIRAWCQQVDSIRDQRVLFKLLQRTHVFSETQIRERLVSAHDLLRPSLPEFVIRKRSDRRQDILLTYVDGPGKSGASYASVYAEANGIAAQCVVAPANFGEKYSEHSSEYGMPAAIVVMDDIAATGKTLSGNIVEFASRFPEILASTMFRAITIVATASAQSTIDGELAPLRDNGVDIEFRTCDILPDVHYAFPENANVWDSREQAERAKAVCIDLGTRIYADNPLGFGGLGLLVVFPTTVPNNSIPILHSYSRTGSSKSWKPLFPRSTN
jgi:hypothetical protein